MASRNDVKLMSTELFEVVEKLKNIYFKAPSNNKSMQKVSSLSIVVAIHLSVLQQTMPETTDDQTIFDWCVRDGCARYLLEHMDMAQLKKIRILKIFTPEEAILIPQYIERILYLWETLRQGKPWETFVTKIGSQFTERYHRILPKEWHKARK